MIIIIIMQSKNKTKQTKNKTKQNKKFKQMKQTTTTLNKKN
jgi:hypothetical protein